MELGRMRARSSIGWKRQRDDLLTVSTWFDACLDCRRRQDPNRLNRSLAVSR
jgi:hypothetical protein